MQINIRLIFTALAMQFVVAFTVLRTSLGQAVLQCIAGAIKRLYEFADDGAGFCLVIWQMILIHRGVLFSQ